MGVKFGVTKSELRNEAPLLALLRPLGAGAGPGKLLATTNPVSGAIGAWGGGLAAASDGRGLTRRASAEPESAAGIGWATTFSGCEFTAAELTLESPGDW